MNPKFLRWRQRKRDLGVVTLYDSCIVFGVHAGLLRVFDNELGNSYQTTLISAKRDPDQLKNRVYEDLKRYKYDALLTLGRGATHAAREATLHYGDHTPVIFGGVVDPVGEGLVASEQSSGNNLTGVSAANRDYTVQVRRFMDLEYKFKRMVVIRSSLDYEQNIIQLDKATKYLRKNGIEVESLVLTGNENVRTLLEESDSKPDVIMLGFDSFLTCFAPEIIRYCNDNKVVLFASDSETVKLGAAIGYCDPSKNMGSALAEKALGVLLENKKPYEVPITTMEWEGRFVYNKGACFLQGMDRIAGGTEIPTKSVIAY